MNRVIALLGVSGLFAAGCAASTIDVVLEPASPAELTSADDAPPVDDLAFEPDQGGSDPDAVRVVVDMDVDSDLIFDGNYVAEYPAEALHWTAVAELDPAAGYGFFAVGGEAEPGDTGCYEQLETVDGASRRDSFDGNRLQAFVPLQGRGTLVPELEALRSLDAASLQAAHGTAAWETVETDEGLIRTTVLLGAEGVASVRAVLPDLGGIATSYTSGSLVSAVDGEGALVEIVLEASMETDSRRETLIERATFEPLDASVRRVTSGSPWTPTLACPSIGEQLAGEWHLTDIDGTDAAALDHLGAAVVVIGADGLVSGSTGCRSFSGSADFGFDWLADVAIDFAGEPCEGIEGVVEEHFLQALGVDPTVSLDHDGRLTLEAGQVGHVAVLTRA